MSAPERSTYTNNHSPRLSVQRNEVRRLFIEGVGALDVLEVPFLDFRNLANSCLGHDLCGIKRRQLNVLFKEAHFIPHASLAT